jgi:hypothetical protein
MHEQLQSPEAASWLASLSHWLLSAAGVASALFWKFCPAPLGALVMVIFDTPKTRRELFIRLSVAFLFGSMFAPVVFDFLRTFSWFTFLDAGNRRHFGAVEFFTAGCGWTVLSAWATWQRRARENPAAAVQEIRDIAP